VYWHAPNRWIHSPGTALAGQLAPLRMALQVGRRPLQRWDRAAARRGDLHLANSTAVQQRLRELYGIDAEVLHPPFMLGHGEEAALPGVEPGFVLLVSRSRAYKNVGSVVDAFRSLPDKRLVVVGDAPRGGAAGTPPNNVRFVGSVTDAQLRWAYRHATALVAPAIEDFGLTPVEAAAFGTPTVARRGGGYLDTVVEDRTGVFFDPADPQAVADAVRACVERDWDTAVLVEHAGRFSLSHFTCELASYVELANTSR
jgi:glycosyltransferase involved in cell wall biosynthesis